MEENKMKNRKLLCLMSLLSLASVTITGCGNKPTPSSPSESSPAESSTNSEKPSSPSEKPSSPAESSPNESSSTGGQEITHRDPFVVELAEGAQTRAYKEAFDVMLDDFSGASLVGTNTNGTHNANDALRVLVDNTATGFPGSPDASIYKVGTGTHDIDKFEGIGFKMRVVSGTVSLDNLVLGLRGGDEYNVFELNLANAVNPDGDALEALTDQFQDIVVCPNLSIEDADEVYKNKDGSNSTLKVLEEILGLHLFAKGECSAIIEIQEVFLTKAGEKTVVDAFNRKAVNKTDDTCWWRDSTGFIVSKSIALADGASYKVEAAEAHGKDNIVLDIQGDTTGTTIAVVKADGTLSAEVAWKDLKNAENAPVVNAVEGAFFPLVINLANSGLPTDGKGVVVKSTTEIALRAIFASSLQEKEAALEYPLLDTENAVVFDNFNRTQGHVDKSYEEAAANTVVTDAGLYYSIAYHNDQLTTVDGDNLVFAITGDDYIQVTEGSSRAGVGYQYMVFNMKLGAGTDLNNFRINSNNSGVTYANQWYAGPGLKSIPADMSTYPYADADGYAWYIIDLEETGITANDAMDIYYTGNGTLYIDSIFFANEWT